ncbi:response regulator transcription factor [Cohnella soli]|uniref:Response regulator n=1 Tax=Cohnella soli TaxID=425005 RepID=A0ABW0I3U4_9BACL
MYRLLIVDNEDYVVEGLINVFHQLTHLDLEVIGAYSGKEALERLQRTKIDIVVSDIRMPGMDGMTLQHEICRLWPSCQMIFLSGFNDFDYVQKAIRKGAVDYVLKTDGDEVVIAAVEKAIQKLEAAIEIEQLIAKSKSQMQMAMAALQKEFFSNLLQGDRIGESIIVRQFEELQIPLNPSLPALQVVGRVDEWAEGISYYDRYLLMYSIRNIASEYLDTTVDQVSIVYDRFNLIWFIQPKELHPSAVNRVQEETWSMVGRFVQGTFERIQMACKELIKLKLSVVLANRPIEWKLSARKFAEIKSKLSWGLGSGQELLIVDQEETGREASNFTTAQDTVHRLNRLEQCLENNLKSEFMAILRELFQKETYDKNYYMVVSLLFSLQAGERSRAAEIPLEWDRLARPDLHESWNEAVEYLVHCAEAIFDYKDRILHEEEDELVGKVKKLIADNLANELSLTVIADKVKHNSSYLSRLFKQKNGIGVSEYISDFRIQKTKELLADPSRKINDIATAAGFASVQYFYRVFKKATQMTPQEFRDRSAGK